MVESFKFYWHRGTEKLGLQGTDRECGRSLKTKQKNTSGKREQGSTINLRRNEWKWAGCVHAGLISRWDQVRLSEGKNRDYRQEWQAVKWEENWWQGKKEQAMDCWTLWYYFQPLFQVVVERVASTASEFFLALTRGIWIQVKKVRSDTILHSTCDKAAAGLAQL